MRLIVKMGSFHDEFLTTVALFVHGFLSSLVMVTFSVVLMWKQYYLSQDLISPSLL